MQPFVLLITIQVICHAIEFKVRHLDLKNKISVNDHETRAILNLFEINNNYKRVKVNHVPIYRLI